MKIKNISIFRCPKDYGLLNLKDSHDKLNIHIEDGVLVCKICNKEYPIINGVPRFVEFDNYTDSFSFEWDKHARTQLEIDVPFTTKVFNERMSYNKNEINGKLILDAGTGVGRFAAIVLEKGAKVIGVDMSLSVNQASENFSSDPNAEFVQADLNCLPFEYGIFDHIFSIGVLHHTPNPKRAFFALIPYLKPGGSISISVYNKGALLYEYSKRLRTFTTTMKKKNLYMLCKIATRLLYPIYRLPIFKLLIYYLPINMHPNYQWRLLDTFDAYSPMYASTHTYIEVYQWFKDAGLENIELLGENAIGIKGWKTKE